MPHKSGNSGRNSGSSSSNSGNFTPASGQSYFTPAGGGQPQPASAGGVVSQGYTGRGAGSGSGGAVSAGSGGISATGGAPAAQITVVAPTPWLQIGVSAFGTPIYERKIGGETERIAATAPPSGETSGIPLISQVRSAVLDVSAKQAPQIRPEVRLEPTKTAVMDKKPGFFQEWAKETKEFITGRKQEVVSFAVDYNIPSGKAKVKDDHVNIGYRAAKISEREPLSERLQSEAQIEGGLKRQIKSAGAFAASYGEFHVEFGKDVVELFKADVPFTEKRLIKDTVEFGKSVVTQPREVGAALGEEARERPAILAGTVAGITTPVIAIPAVAKLGRIIKARIAPKVTTVSEFQTQRITTSAVPESAADISKIKTQVNIGGETITGIAGEKILAGSREFRILQPEMREASTIVRSEKGKPLGTQFTTEVRPGEAPPLGEIYEIKPPITEEGLSVAEKVGVIGTKRQGIAMGYLGRPDITVGAAQKITAVQIVGEAEPAFQASVELFAGKKVAPKVIGAGDAALDVMAFQRREFKLEKGGIIGREISRGVDVRKKQFDIILPQTGKVVEVSPGVFEEVSLRKQIYTGVGADLDVKQASQLQKQLFQNLRKVKVEDLRKARYYQGLPSRAKIDMPTYSMRQFIERITPLDYLRPYKEEPGITRIPTRDYAGQVAEAIPKTEVKKPKFRQAPTPILSESDLQFAIKQALISEAAQAPLPKLKGLGGALALREASRIVRETRLMGRLEVKQPSFTDVAQRFKQTAAPSDELMPTISKNLFKEPKEITRQTTSEIQTSKEKLGTILEGRNALRDVLRGRTTTGNIPKEVTIPKVDEILIPTITPKIVPELIPPYTPPRLKPPITPPRLKPPITRPIITTPPTFVPLKFPSGFRLHFPSPKIPISIQKRKFRYTPSLVASELNIVAPKGVSGFTGFEVRGLPKKFKFPRGF